MRLPIFATFLSLASGFVAGASSLSDTVAFSDASVHDAERQLFDAEPASFARTRLPVVILSGGRSTCLVGATGEPRYGRHIPAFKAWSDALVRIAVDAGRRTPVVILTCFAKNARSVYLTSSRAPRANLTLPSESVAKYVLGLAASEPNGIDLFWYGHSYGAALAATSVAREGLALATRVLVTVDAIGPRDCHVEKYVSYTLGRMRRADVSWSLEVDGCNRFPAELGEDGLARLEAATGVWINAYQTQFQPLHSGAAATADRNEKLDLAYVSNTGHDDLAIDRRAQRLFTDAYAAFVRRQDP